jgi:hypothetical protein
MTAQVQTIFKIYTSDGCFRVETHPECLEAENPTVRVRWYELGAQEHDAELIIDSDAIADLAKILSYFVKRDVH